MSVINKFFDAVYCINLPSRPERRRYCEFLFRKLGWDVEFVDGFDGSGTRSFGEMTGGTFGASISHARVVADAWARGLNNYLVLEDDISIRTDINDRLAAVLDRAPKDWGFLYLGWIPWHSHYEDHVDDDWDQVHGMNGMHATGVSRAAFLHYLAGLLKFDAHCDQVATKLHDTFAAYCPRINWISQAGIFPSDAFPDKAVSVYEPSWDDYITPQWKLT